MRRSPSSAIAAGAIVLALVLALATGDAVVADDEARAKGPPQRVVSLNLCADQYLLALADRDQIAALTHFAVDPAISALHREAAGLPLTRGSAEEVIRLDPDLVITGTYTRRQTRELLERLGFRVHVIDAARSFDVVRRTTRALAGLLGHRGRGERLVASLERRIAEADAKAAQVPAVSAPTALYYQRRGFANGADSLVSEIMRAAGLRNLAVDLGVVRTGRVELERIVMARPDYLVLDSLSPRLEDQGTALLGHPALLATIPPARRVALPQALVICGGPMTVDAIDHLVDAIDAVSAR
ncbi:MAG: ABC transporter substrate-binding protein [Gammaproteobacteria bacterium]|nr:ABC transporter substrate-binding protein [Gammaproteobacteria bacterium]